MKNEQDYENNELLLLSADYDGKSKKALLKFYDPKNENIVKWQDESNHLPYCVIKTENIDEETKKEILQKDGVVKIENITKTDLLKDKKIDVLKIITKTPDVIGGQGNSIRNMKNVTAHEANIKYYETYMYDAGLVPGTFYNVNKTKITPVKYDSSEQAKEFLQTVQNTADGDIKKGILEWAELLNQPLPDIKRLALDIEVVSSERDVLADSNEAKFPILSIAVCTSDNKKQVYVLKRDDEKQSINKTQLEYEIILYSNEEELLKKTFSIMSEYPCIVTYNGDEFDLRYIYNRAIRLGLEKSDIPIKMGRKFAGMQFAHIKHGIHLDLYRTFNNRSLQIYAFGNKYIEHTLEAVSSALIGKSKVDIGEKFIGDLPIHELAEYNFNDAKITLELTSFNNNLLIKLLLVISRVSKMPINDLSRLGVSNWIRSLIYFEHRKINAIIPNREDLVAERTLDENNDQEIYTKAIISGKKYQGGMVVEPKPGVHFNVAVLDFSSLYPSIIKVNNLSYETVRCNHEEDRTNIIKGTNHWVCKKRNGIMSNVIGSLRDIRVNYYKPLPKLKELKEDERNLYQVVSQALKVILNASYGVMGAEIFPLYYLPVADTTTAIGRNIISETIEKAQKSGIEVLYGDTDSLFLKSPTKTQIDEITEWSTNKLGIELELEKEYRYVAFSSRKKNYFGVNKDGTVDIKGLTGKKSHIPPFVKNAFYNTMETLSKVNTQNDFEKARNDIKIDIKNRMKNLKNNEVSLDDLAFRMMMSKPIEKYIDNVPQHVKAAKILKEKTGKQYKAGNIIRFIKTNGTEGVKPIQLAKIREVDKKKYEEIMRSTFDQLLDSLGYSFDEILGVTKLEDLLWGNN